MPCDMRGAGESPFSMLGLGDIVIPGIFVAMCLRYDVEHGSSYFRRYSQLLQPCNRSRIALAG